MDRKLYEVFRAGKYPQGEFTVADVKQIALNYDPNFCEAPVWIGHPKTDSEPPALAWVGGCVADEEGKLYVWLSSMSDEFVHLITTKKFKRVSVEFWKFEQIPGWYLYAIGLTNRGQITQLPPIEFTHAGLKNAVSLSTKVIQKRNIIQPIHFNFNNQNNKTMNNLISEFARTHNIDITGLDDEAAFSKIAEFFDAEQKSASQKIAQFTQQNQSLEEKIKEYEAKEILSIIDLGIAEGKLVASQREAMREFGAKHGAEELKKFIASMPKQNIYDANVVNNRQPSDGSGAGKFTIDGQRLTFSRFIEECRKNPAFANQFTEEEIQKLKKGEL